MLLQLLRHPGIPGHFKKYILVITAALSLAVTDGLAQTTLRIISAENGMPVIGATVTVIDSQTQIVSDSSGVINLSVSEGSLLINHVAYETRRIDLSKISGNAILLDPSTKQLDEVIVRGYDLDSKLLDNAGPISIISPLEFQRYNEASAVPVLNSVPGVRMEERSTGSYRISIRGSLLRSPFGVRNVKVYWNDIPFTEPNGNTPFNLLDINNMGKIEVIKGPAGSIYGAGTGGAINIQGVKAPFDKQLLNTSISIGSFNTQRYQTTFLSGSEEANLSVNLTRHTSDGYRDHSELSRNVGQLLGHFRISPKRTLSTSLLFSDLDYQIPGGLNQVQYDENPRQSRPGSISQDASIDINTFQVGLAQDYQFSDHASNVTSIYGLGSVFRNPFITDYKRESQQALGGRSRFLIDGKLASMDFRANVGAEFQTSFTSARNFGNVMGQPDTIRFDDEIRATQSIIFAQIQLYLQPDLILVTGVSANNLKYKVDRLINAISGSPSVIEREFDTEVSPRVGLTKKLGRMAVHASVSSGFSPPTLAEFRTNEGSLNTALQAERGVNYELGLRGTTAQNRLNFDLALFSFRLKETIVTQTAPSGVVIFSNAGETLQPGAELFLSYDLLNEEQPGFVEARVRTSYTYHKFEFKDYIKRQNDFSGNELTGVAPNIVVSSLDLKIKGGIYTFLTHNYTDRIPLNDANDVYSSSYNLVELKVGWQQKVRSKLELNLFVGANNLFDEKLSLGNDLNPFGGRYFQPAPGRNYYGGIKVQWDLTRDN